MGEFRMKMKLGFEEMEEIVRGEGKREVGLQEMEELRVMVGSGESEIRKRSEKGSRRRRQNRVGQWRRRSWFRGLKLSQDGWELLHHKFDLHENGETEKSVSDQNPISFRRFINNICSDSHASPKPVSVRA